MDKKTEYYKITKENVIKQLNSSETGLTNDEAEQRIYKYGLNEINKPKDNSALKILLNQFTSPIVWILIGAIIISLILNKRIDSIIIAIIIILNTILGFFQEYKAEKAIDALKQLASPKARVLRNNQEIMIDSKNLVPGDILILREGDKIPGDARLLEANYLQSEQASLTGESHPSKKHTTAITKSTILAERNNMIYSSTSITTGNGKAIVTETGMSTEVGKIAKLIHESHEVETPLQKKLKNLGKYLTIAVIIVAIITFLGGLLRGEDFTTMIITAIALAVAAIPEGLPAVITISLALGVQRMIKRNALVRKLPSVESLGSVNVICTDKTGTLTHNEMTIKKLWANNNVYDVSGSGYDSKGEITCKNEQVNLENLEELLKTGFYCNNAKFDKNLKVLGDPTEAALLVSAKKSKINILTEKRIKEIPFSSERKMMTVVHQKYSYSKGAVETILIKCDRILINNKIQRLTQEQRNTILNENINFASEALRVLAFAYNDKKIEKNMIFLGLQAMIDPPRIEAKEAIEKCKTAGIRVIMITGDHLITAEAIAKELNIEGDATTGEELKKSNLKKIIKSTSIFARVEPAQKLEIVKALKENGYIVAMTGDGVNDAPALKKADIGISMGITGTDVAKEASDMILTDDNFSSIVNAIEEGRGIFDNIRKFVNYLLSSNLAEILVVFIATLFGMPLPLTAIQILWINLVTDGLPAIALGLDPAEKDIMKKPPRSPNENIISKSLGVNMGILGVLMAIMTLILFSVNLESGLGKARTIAFTSLVVFEIARLQLIRSEYKLSFFSNKYLSGAVLISLGLQLLILYSPLRNIFGLSILNPIDWVWIIVATGSIIFINKIINLFRTKTS